MHPRLRLALLLLCVLLVGGRPDEASAQARPEGEMRWALYVTLSPVWFDPGEVSGQLTPFWVLYAHARRAREADARQPHDARAWPSRGRSAPTSSVYEFKLREGLKFHNGDPFTAEDVKFSFQRAKGSKILHDKVRRS